MSKSKREADLHAQNEFIRWASERKRRKGTAIRRLTDGAVAVAYRTKLITKKQYTEYTAAAK